jgi:hypothetical protein
MAVNDQKDKQWQAGSHAFGLDLQNKDPFVKDEQKNS